MIPPSEPVAEALVQRTEATARADAGTAIRQDPFAAEPTLWTILLEELQRTTSVRTRVGWSWPRWLTAGFFISMGLGLARLGVGLRGIARLRARSQPIDDRELDDAVDIVRAELSCTRPVEVRELADLSTPATIGWRRPLLLLPGDWREWSADERRAVLAHELAHVCRGDFLAGLLAQFALAMHFYHPLAHWLAARLRLEQELAADAWGARLSGGKPSYLATLARMALRRDGRAMTWPVRPFLPSHGTFVRRIEMLRNAKHIHPESPPIAARILTFVVLAALGLLVAGLRGPIGESPALAQGQPAARPEGNGTPAGAETYNLAYLPADTKMVLAIRPGSLIRRPEIQSLVDAIGQGSLLGKGLLVAPGDVEQVLVFWEGDSLAQIQPGRSTLVPPPSGLVLRTSRAQDWKALLGRLFGADSREARHDGQTYSYMFPNGPHRWGVYMPDDRTLVAAEEVLLREQIEDRNAPPSSHVWDEAWKKVSKGQLMLALETRWLRRRIALVMAGGPAAPMLPSAGMSAGFETFSPLLEKARSYAVGIVASDKGLGFDLVARTGSETDAKPVVETLQALLTLGKNAANGVRRDLDRKTYPGRGAMEWVLQAAGSLLEKARVETSEGLVRLHAESPVDLAEGLRLLVPSVTSARAASRRSMSVNNLKQIGLAFHNHNSMYGHLPASVNLGGKSKSIPYSWRVAILPFIEQQALYDAYNFDEPWDGPNNRKLIDKMPAIYTYPDANGTPSTRGNSSYFVFTGRSTALSGASEPTGTAGGSPGAVAPHPVAAPTGPGIAQITDGTSYTILAVEARRDIPWTKPEDIPLDLNAPLPDLGGFTPDGFNALFADGAVRFLKKSIAPNILKALITRDGGEVISEW